MNVVGQTITSFVANQEVDDCADYIGELKEKMEAYSYVYNMLEVNYVVDKLKDIMETVVAGSSLGELEKEYLKLAAEKIYGLAN